LRNRYESSSICAGLNINNWKCAVTNGASFAIIQTWQGGYQFNNHIKQCTTDAWNAGMKHVDLYVFMCPNCAGNNPPETAVTNIVNNLRNQGVKYGMIWFDVEQCSGCWNDAASNVAWLRRAINQAKGMGVHVGMYSSIGEWSQTFGTDSSFHDLPLWYAHYDGSASFGDSWAYHFGGWTKPAIKQYNDHGPCFTVDVNWYPNSVEELKQIWNTTTGSH